MMGREIRKVPPNWEHPTDDNGHYIPMLPGCFNDAMNEWVEEWKQWQEGRHEYQIKYPENSDMEYWEFCGGPPNPNYYTPEFEQEPTWYQVYENVSEGTPVTPPFATKEEIVDYLVSYGTFWDQSRGDGGWDKEAAEKFVEFEYAPSGLFVTGKGYFQPKDKEMYEGTK